jgi:hypothetical protein
MNADQFSVKVERRRSRRQTEDNPAAVGSSRFDESRDLARERPRSVDAAGENRKRNVLEARRTRNVGERHSSTAKVRYHYIQGSPLKNGRCDDVFNKIGRQSAFANHQCLASPRNHTV